MSPYMIYFPSKKEEISGHFYFTIVNRILTGGLIIL